MAKLVFSHLAVSAAICALAIGCAKADYYEKSPAVLSTFSADNDLTMHEGEKKDFPVQMTGAAPETQTYHWRIISDKYNVKERFKTPEGTTTITKGQRVLQITVAAVDVDDIAQGDQVFEVELEAADGTKTKVSLTLLDVQNKSRVPGKGKGRPDLGHDRRLEFDVKDQGTQSLVKVLLVIDNSYSMKLKQDQLADGIRSIAKSLAGKNLQFFLYTTSNDYDEDGRFDKRTLENKKGHRGLHAPFQDADLIITQDMPKDEFDDAVADLQKNILSIGHVGSKNESALCTLNNILNEKDAKKQILTKGDDALVFILSDTDDHARDVPVYDCGGTVSPRKIVSSLNELLGRKHYGITAVISNHQANQGHECGKLILDEGKQYTELVKSSPTPNQIFSICSKDYSEALDSVNVFSRQAIVNEFKLNLQDREQVTKVQLIRDGKETTLAEDQYEVRGQMLRISQKHLRVGDRLRVSLKKI
jgi:hypothetical protein